MISKDCPKAKTLKQQLQDDANKDFHMQMINASHVRIENAMKLFSEWLTQKQQEILATDKIDIYRELSVINELLEDINK